MKFKLKTMVMCAAMFLGACASISPAEKSALLTDAGTLANIGVTAAATYYGGPAAGQLASSGISALGSVLQGYVGTTAPQDVLVATPGATAVGQALAAQISPTRTVTQADVNLVNQAAAIAATLKPVAGG